MSNHNPQRLPVLSFHVIFFENPSAKHYGLYLAFVFACAQFFFPLFASHFTMMNGKQKTRSELWFYVSKLKQRANLEKEWGLLLKELM
jgi:hypothetical protein